MNNIPRTRIQDLKEAFASIVSMMLGLLRAHGVRGLLYLPEVWLATREIKRMAHAMETMLQALHARYNTDDTITDLGTLFLAQGRRLAVPAASVH